MAAPTVYEGVADDFQLEGVGQLFAGTKFWVAQRVPFRNRLIDDIKANGGEIVMLEKKADYMIADHFRSDCPAGSISYEFVEKSIKDGRLRDPEDHRAGPRQGDARDAGALHRPTKGTRSSYTAEEDNILYKWVRDCEKSGGQISGNEIYKQLEAQYPRHPWQSWRDRYLKVLRNRPSSDTFAEPPVAKKEADTVQQAEEDVIKAAPAIAQDRSSSLAPHPESDASTTLSLQDFRRSLNGEDEQPQYPNLQPLPRHPSPSPAPSDASSTGSGDPDIPLEADEIDDFFDEMTAEGHTPEFITRALKRTRLRPELAEIVLDAWSRGEPLPHQRGIWSLEDDEAAESGDGLVLAKLERKHTLDGWGGVTERLRFLEGYRGR